MNFSGFVGEQLMDRFEAVAKGFAFLVYKLHLDLDRNHFVAFVDHAGVPRQVHLAGFLLENFNKHIFKPNAIGCP